MKNFVRREPGSGVPALPWAVREYFGDYADYEGHAFVTCDPKGLGRSVCDGFIDDMRWITDIHNRLIGRGWRARLARRVLCLSLTPPAVVPSDEAPSHIDGSGA